MIIFKHALRRTISQPINLLIILILPIGLIFIPPTGYGYPTGLYLYGMLSLFTGFLLCKPIVEERMNKIILRISAAPIDYINYLFSHLLAYVLIFAVQSIIFIIGIAVYWNDIAINYALVFSLHFTFNIMAVAFCFFWNSLFKSYNLSFGIFSGVGSILCLISGISMPLRIIPEAIRNIAILLPTYWLPYGLDSLYEGNIKIVTISLFVLLLYSIIFLLIGSRRRY
ncbi:ABC transporter permease [Sedimentibacter sp.]|uniref:ABC transporter permease n=1 Tax=Sedimentibacter sp. TaxID=1960295 RepID=UPI002898AD98|nr:ABC transporter permease [Sedimentibacter sp.]